MRRLTPVTTRSMTAESWSTWAVTAVWKAPALIHGKRSPVHVSPCQTRAKTLHAAANESAMAGTATQCARRPMAPPRTALTTVPRSGKSGISQTTSGMVVLSGTKPGSLYRMGSGVSRTDRLGRVRHAARSEGQTDSAREDPVLMRTLRDGGDRVRRNARDVGDARDVGGDGWVDSS